MVVTGGLVVVDGCFGWFGCGLGWFGGVLVCYSVVWWFGDGFVVVLGSLAVV